MENELTPQELRKICFQKETDHMLAESVAKQWEGDLAAAEAIKVQWHAKKAEIRARYPYPA